MLVLGRTINEDIVISDDKLNVIARIRVCDILCGDLRKAKIGVIADRSLNVDRGEVYDKRAREVMSKARGQQ